MNGNWLNLLGLARRAGFLLAGTESVSAAVRRGQVDLIVISADIAAGTRDRMFRLARAHMVPIIQDEGCGQLDRLTGYPGRRVFGVTNGQLAKAIVSSRKDAR